MSEVSNGLDFKIDENHFNSYKSNPEFTSLLSELELYNTRFKNIPSAQRELALYLILNNKTDIVSELNSLLYKRHVPTIEEFLTEEYLPGHPITTPGNIWKDELIEIFNPSKSYYEHILTGAIGTAKTSTAVVAQFYNLYRLTSLRNPQLVMGSGPSKPMCLLLFGITLTKSARTILSQVRSILQSSKYFHKVKKKAQFDDVLLQSGNTVVPYVETSGIIEFPNSIMITFGSQIQHSIGEDLFGCIFDEAEYRLASTSEVTTDLYLEVSKRIQSRFIGKRFIMVNLVSSIRNEFGVIAQYIKNGGAGKEFTRISSFNMWEFQASCGKLPKEALTKLFYVMRGTKTHPSKILDEVDSKRYETGEFKIPPGCEILSIPTVYYDKFKLGVNKSLMDIAGVSIQTMDTPFDDLEGIQDKNLMPIITIDAPLMSDEPLLNQFPKNQFIETPYGKKLRRYPEVRRHIHMDLADTGEAGIAMVHKERFKNGQTAYVVDFCIRIISPDRISLESVKNFILDLKRVLGINLSTLTADQYQSTSMLQYFEKNKVAKEVKRISVDRNLDGYSTLNSIISEKVLRIGQMNELATQLHNIYFTDNKPYVHVGRKDLADCLTGAVYNAAVDALDVPINPYFSDEGEDIKKFNTYVKDNFTELEDI